MKSSLILLKEAMEALNACKAYVPAKKAVEIKNLVDDIQYAILQEELIVYKKRHRQISLEDFQDTIPQSLS
jgi:hypothetical protein